MYYEHYDHLTYNIADTISNSIIITLIIVIIINKTKDKNPDSSRIIWEQYCLQELYYPSSYVLSNHLVVILPTLPAKEI